MKQLSLKIRSILKIVFSNDFIVITRSNGHDGMICNCDEDMMITYCPTIAKIDKVVIMKDAEEQIFSSSN